MYYDLGWEIFYHDAVQNNGRITILNEREEKLVVTIPNDLTLDDSERSLLRKGLGFVPVNKRPNTMQSLEDLNRFYRKVRLHAFFNNLDQTVDERNKETDSCDDEFKILKKASGSSFTPKEGQFQAVDRFISKCRDDFSQAHFKPPKSSNLTK